MIFHLARKIPNYVTHHLNDDMIYLESPRAITFKIMLIVIRDAFHLTSKTGIISIATVATVAVNGKRVTGWRSQYRKYALPSLPAMLLVRRRKWKAPTDMIYSS